MSILETAEISGENYFFSGASSGIGAATAIYMAGRGATVTLSGRNVENLNGVKEECVKAGGKVSHIH